MSKRDVILDKLQKLMAKRDSIASMGNMEEANLFTEKISELSLQYKIEMTEVELASIETSDPIEAEIVRHGEGMRQRKRVSWQMDLALVIATAHFCRIIIYRNSNSVTFVGRKSDRAVAIYMFVYLARTIQTVSKAEYDRIYHHRRNVGGDTESMRGWRRSFIEGAIHTIHERLQAVRQSVEVDATENQMALMKVSDVAVQKWYEDFTSGMTKGAKRQDYRLKQSMQGRAAGERFGATVPLRGGVGGGDRSIGRLGTG